MKYAAPLSISIAILMVIIISNLSIDDTANIEREKLQKLKIELTKKRTPRVDHSQFEILKKKFKTPQEVTEACLSCHNLTADDIMQSNHWHWEREEYVQGIGVVYLGKANAINNYCIGAAGNEGACAKCHIGYGMDSEGKVFVDKKNIDCMVCHDQTETYIKAQNMAGAPAPNVDFSFVAQNVGRPNRTNCGVCHFYGGGGDGVKHGDLDASMFSPTRDIDIHMAIDGPNLVCVDCHKTHRHNIAGKLYSLSSMNRNRVFSEDCHSSMPHKDDMINEHTLKVSCQTCHIPIYAKKQPTKMYWDWSKAGKLKNGKPYKEIDSLGKENYLSTKGFFVWKIRQIPDYIWFNGTASHYIAGQKIENSEQTLILNQLYGSYDDPDSKIIPLKIHRGKIPYDPINKILIKPKLFAEKEGLGAFWKDFDWIRASEVGHKEFGLPFSGKVDFIETAMYWPLNHMVSRKEEALQCVDCHNRENSRLAGLKDFYLPGRDRSEAVDLLGKLALLFSIIGVIAHSTARIYFYFRNKKNGEQNG